MGVVWGALWFVGGLVATVVGVVCMVGAVLPRDHVASGSAVVPASADEVWRLVRTVSEIPSWRKGVSKVDGVEGEVGSASAWTEHHGTGPLRLIHVGSEAGRRLEMRIDETGQPFGGTWTVELSPEGAGTRVRVTERGFVKLPPFRFVAKFLIGHRASLVSYLRDLSIAMRGDGVVLAS